MLNASVIIPTYNRSKLLELTLQSLIKQRHQDVKFEVIVVDDGSTDNTRDIVYKYKTSLHELQYIHQTHLGFRVAKARNLGIDSAKGDVILFVDSGMILHQDYIYEHYKMHLNSGNSVIIGNVYGFAADTDDKDFIQMVDFNNLDASFERIGYCSKYTDPRIESYRNFDFKIENVPAPYYYFWTCNISIRRDNILACEKFDENFTSWGMEDIELGYKLYKKGLIFKTNTNAKSIHYPHDSASEAREKLTSNRDKNNKLYFHNKYMCLESELLLTGAHDMFYNEALVQINEKENRRYDYSNISDNCLLDIPACETTLVIGSHNGSIQRKLSEFKMLEHNIKYLRMLERRLGAAKVHHLFGSITPFQDKEFDNVLITDLWRIYPFEWVKKLFIEALRIGHKVYIVSQITADGITMIDDEKTLSDFLKVRNVTNSELIKKDNNSSIQYFILSDIS